MTTQGRSGGSRRPQKASSCCPPSPPFVLLLLPLLLLLLASPCWSAAQGRDTTQPATQATPGDLATTTTSTASSNTTSHPSIPDLQPTAPREESSDLRHGESEVQDPPGNLLAPDDADHVGGLGLVIHKCCPEDEVFDHATKTCQPSHDLTFSVPIFTVDYYGVYMESNLTRDQVELWTSLLDCERYLLDAMPGKKPEFDFRVLDSGHLWVPEYEHQYDLDHYCLENFVLNASVKGSPHIQGAMVCVLQTEVETYDPSKIPVRKCCMPNEVYDSVSSCSLRYNVTSEPWLVPFRSLEETNKEVKMVDIREPPFVHTHELVPNFQTCVGDQMGWQVDAFHVQQEEGGLYVPLLHRVIPDNQYCIEDFHTNGSLATMAYVCVSVEEMQHLQRLQTPGCQTEPCIPKCCHLGEILDAGTSRCVPANNYPFSPSVRLENGSLIQVAEPDYRFGFPECEVQLTYDHERVELLPQGDLRYVTNDTRECLPEQAYAIPRGEYCIDQVYYPSGEVRQGAGFCFSNKWEHLGQLEKQDVNYLYSVFLGVSDLFILISFVVYLTVPDQNKRGLNKNVKLAHSVLGRILLCFLFSLFFAYLFLIIIKLFSDPINLSSPSACIGIGVCMYVFFMATFFWLNVLCFELWWKCARQESSSGRRWVWYQVYAWACPLVFGGVSLIMEFAPSISSCYIKPNFGTYSCFFSYSVTHNNGAKWAYFFGPVAVLLFADLVFFLLTVRSLLVTVQQSHKGTVQRQARQRLRLCFKLFLVMGISWLAEIISFELGPSTVWYISDVFNCFQGFIIFLIFILKPKILQAVRARLCGCCGAPPPAKPRGPTVLRGTSEEMGTGSDIPIMANTRSSQDA
ncbi:probable G-protein coupled receptor Mth-like 1 isoform X2 [Eriocheir sinensis]|uniref:probable G-protein coupled receptor Mth-like 1 isoform X2 n=1 Tax=Eriocheir sinensis TaxID=95602 RepID=UPI0021C86DEB|nr:probable G-protein coupled receptor Mth-like 1 isoform X2 [Eriocheir sinensis]